MEPKKYTFKYIYLADGIIGNVMANMSFVLASLKFCVLDKKALDRIQQHYDDTLQLINNLMDLEKTAFFEWQKENGDAKER